MTLDTLQYLFRYNTWATELAFAAAELLSPAEYEAPGCSGHGSVRDTLAHVMVVQERWIATLAGTQSPEDAIKPPFTGADVPTVADARSRWRPIDTATHSYLDGLTEAQVLDYIELHHPARGTLKALLWRLLLHVGNHGTHHRAQIVAAVRRAGHAPPGNDLLFFSMTPAGR